MYIGYSYGIGLSVNRSSVQILCIYPSCINPG